MIYNYVPLLLTDTEKAALAGTSGTPGALNKYVTDADPRLVGGSAPPAGTGYRHVTAGVEDPVAQAINNYFPGGWV